MKVFFDTNVLISAFAARGLCADLMRLVLAEHELQTGEVNLVELRRVLTERFNASGAQVDRVEDLLREVAVIAPPDESTISGLTPRDAWELLRHTPAS
ncbi:MAG: hypothetical protein IT357_07875 [Gemmatimonadaceae bacterium]|nr:hypothetical protein [Gemmatimonadaceae bacterium]